MDLKTHKLSYSINGTFLIKNIDLSFSNNVLYAILGPNGAGKTTLLKILSGIWKPSFGQIFWQGQDLSKLSRQNLSKIISLVPQYTSVPFEFTVKEIVSMGLYSQGKKINNSYVEVEESLEMVGASHLKNRFISNLSHGERKLIYIARSLITKSPILLLDEPTASLDLYHQSIVWNLLKKLSAQGKTILIATHDIPAVKEYCDVATVLNKGMISAIGSSKSVLTTDNLNKFFGPINSLTQNK